jgi:hypothetical protein
LVEFCGSYNAVLLQDLGVLSRVLRHKMREKGRVALMGSILLYTIQKFPQSHDQMT